MKQILLAWGFLMLIFEIEASPFRQAVSDQEMMKHGRQIYRDRCLGCHGPKGDGLGPASPFLDPKPRNFITGTFKFKSTPNESLPSDRDLMRTLSYGVPGTSMPSFRLMPEVSKYAVIQYIKTFSQLWKKPENKGPRLQGASFPIGDFREHKKFIKRAKKGRVLYLQNCLICHGDQGKGDGEGGEELVDDWDFPVRPGNLTRPILKSGASVKDIYRALLTGIAGTPMPSFKEAISDEELWDVAAYVLYLRGLSMGVYDDLESKPLNPITEAEKEEVL